MKRNILEEYLYRNNNEIIIIVSGLSGTQRSSLSKLISNDLSIELINIDKFCDEKKAKKIDFNGKLVNNWDDNDLIDYEEVKKAIEKSKNKCVITGNYIFSDIIKTDLHFHIKIDKEKLYENRKRYLEENKNDCKEEYEIINDLKGFLNKTTWNNYFISLPKMSINYYIPYNDDIQVMYNKIFDDTMKYISKKLSETNHLFLQTNQNINLKNEEPLTYKKETYDDYLYRIKSVDPDNYQWIFDIIEGRKEKDKIIYQDDEFVLVPKNKKNSESIENIHILALVANKELRSLRDLTSDHIPLLNHILKTSLEKLEIKYKIPKESWRAYIHYYPSAWQLHIHFTYLNNLDKSAMIDKSHDLYRVIFNLSLNSKYYQMIELNVIERDNEE